MTAEISLFFNRKTNIHAMGDLLKYGSQLEITIYGCRRVESGVGMSLAAGISLYLRYFFDPLFLAAYHKSDISPKFFDTTPAVFVIRLWHSSARVP